MNFFVDDAMLEYGFGSNPPFLSNVSNVAEVDCNIILSRIIAGVPLPLSFKIVNRIHFLWRNEIHLIVPTTSTVHCFE